MKNNFSDCQCGGEKILYTFVREYLARTQLKDFVIAHLNKISSINNIYKIKFASPFSPEKLCIQI